MMTPNIKLPTTQAIEEDPSLVAMAFGDPDSAMDDKPSWWDLLSAEQKTIGTGKQEYYEPPLPFLKLAKLQRANPQHGPLASLKAKWVARYLIDNLYLSRQTLIRMLIDHEALGNGAFRITRGRKGNALTVSHQPMLKLRRMVDKDHYGLLQDGQLVPFKAGEILHLFEYDPMQEIYGIPYWIGAVQSILLGEEVRIFPRLFFKNGAHAQKLIATAGLSVTMRQVMNKTVKSSKGRGAMKSLMFHLSRGDVDKMIKVFDFAEHAYRIDYSKLAKMASEDVLEAWRIPPELAGQMPENAQSTHDLDKVQQMFYEKEIFPLKQAVMELLNPVLPAKHAVQFREYQPVKDPNPSTISSS